MLDLERAKTRFQNHIAIFQDLGNIKVLDFKEPDTYEYRIRFVFEEDYCRLHISGDLGELTAVNYTNMVWNKFYKDFGHNPGYFEDKVRSHSQPLEYYDKEEAAKDLYEALRFEDIEFDTEEFNTLEDYLKSEFLYDYNDDGIGPNGLQALEDMFSDAWEFAYNLGKRKTGIIDLYLHAFCLAYEQLQAKATETKPPEVLSDD